MLEEFAKLVPGVDAGSRQVGADATVRRKAKRKRKSASAAGLDDDGQEDVTGQGVVREGKGKRRKAADDGGRERTVSLSCSTWVGIDVDVVCRPNRQPPTQNPARRHQTHSGATSTTRRSKLSPNSPTTSLPRARTPRSRRSQRRRGLRVRRVMRGLRCRGRLRRIWRGRGGICGRGRRGGKRGGRGVGRR